MTDGPKSLDGESSRGDGFLCYTALDILTEKAPQPTSSVKKITAKFSWMSYKKDESPLPMWHPVNFLARWRYVDDVKYLVVFKDAGLFIFICFTQRWSVSYMFQVFSNSYYVIISKCKLSYIILHQNRVTDYFETIPWISPKSPLTLRSER